MHWPVRSAFQNPVNYAAAVASELAYPLLRSISKLATRQPDNPSEWRRGLILSPNHLGDVLYRTASLRLLSEGLPNCQWDYLTAPKAKPLLEGNPYIDDILPWQQTNNPWSISKESFNKLKKRNYDVALCTSTFMAYKELTLALSLDIPNRVGYTNKGFSGLITYPITLGAHQPYPRYFRSMVEQITGNKSNTELRPEIYLDRIDYARAKTIIDNIEREPGTPLVACAPLSRATKGNWPPDLFLEKIKELFKGQKYHVVLCGSEDEMGILANYCSYPGIEASLVAGVMEVRDFAAFLQKCAAIVTADSGPRHIANAMGIPVYFMRNTVNPPAEAGPYCSTETDITLK